MNTADRQPDGRDLLVVVLLAAVCLLLRLPGLDRVALNPDESQYEATATYLVATGTSAFALPHTTGGTYTLYKWMTALFGPYPMLHVRVLVLLVCLATTLLLYFILRDAAGRIAGALGGLVFLHYNHWFEGLTANREWFAGLLLVAGAWLYLRSKHRAWMLLAAGLACSAALFFKMQAAYLTLVVPATILLRAERSRLRELLAYASGGALGLGFYFLVFLVVGTLPEYVESIFTDWSSYAGAEESRGAGAALYLRSYFTAQPFRMFLLISYLGAAWGLVARRRVPPAWTLFSVYLVAGLFTVAMGTRFFGHYYLFLMPPVAVLSALVARRAAETAQQTGSSAAIRIASLALLALLAWHAAALGVRTYQRGVPPSLPHHPAGFPALVARLQTAARPGDRLFVWGWLPEIYSLSRLEAASRFTITQFVVDDVWSRPVEPALNASYATLMMRDLRERPPRFIVDAARRSWTLQSSRDPWLYSLELYPDFELVELLRTVYTRVGRFDDCDLYVRTQDAAPTRR